MAVLVRFFRVISIILVVLSLFLPTFSFATPMPTKAQSVKMDFFDWTFYREDREDGFICYLLSTPLNSSYYEGRKGEPFFLVTNVKNSADEIVTSSGYSYKNSVDIQLSFGDKKYYLFPYSGLAWTFDANDDLDVIKEMQQNAKMVVSGVARNNQNTHDTYSLIGFAKAYQKLKEVCINND